MSTRRLVDVGVVTYNTRDLTVAALRRLVESEQGCDLNVLVRDNGSDDGTAEAIVADVAGADVDAGDHNLGFAAGVNTLLRRSTAPWFLALNSDAWPLPGAIGRLIDAAERHPRAALVAPRLERPDGTLEHSTHPFPSPVVAALTAIGHGPPGVARRYLLNGAWMHDEGRTVDWAVGAAWLLRRDAIVALGLLDERFFMYVEDLDWCWRAWRGGWEVWFEPSSVVHHVGNASGSAVYKSARTAAHLRNTYRWYRRHHGRLCTVAYRLLNAAGAARRAMTARAQHDRDLERHWLDAARAHLSPVVGPDGPPER